MKGRQSWLLAGLCGIPARHGEMANNGCVPEYGGRLPPNGETANIAACQAVGKSFTVEGR